jgi:ElaB/YqjD/DUF883 family membrane-anchored ribosome-binding protein
MQDDQETEVRENPPSEGQGSMNQTASDVRDRTMEGATRVKEGVRENVNNFRTSAMDQVEQSRERAAGGVESVAQQVRDRVSGTGGIQETAGVRVAEGMDKTAAYLREHDTKAMMSDFESYTKEHPTQAIMGAVALGFILGRILK